MAIRVLSPARAAALSLVATLSVVLLAACSTTTNGQGVNAGASPAAVNPGAAPAGVLSKADFVTAANAVCKAVSVQRSALPVPSGPTDFEAIVTYLDGTLRLFPPYIVRVKVLVALTADHAELSSNWVSIEEADYTAGQPVVRKTLAAARAHDVASVTQGLNELAALPDHSAQIAAFMSSYGLTDCAALQTS